MLARSLDLVPGSKCQPPAPPKPLGSQPPSGGLPRSGRRPAVDGGCVEPARRFDVGLPAFSRCGSSRDPNRLERGNRQAPRTGLTTGITRASGARMSWMAPSGVLGWPGNRQPPGPGPSSSSARLAGWHLWRSSYALSMADTARPRFVLISRPRSWRFHENVPHFSRSDIGFANRRTRADCARICTFISC